MHYSTALRKIINKLKEISKSNPHKTIRAVNLKIGKGCLDKEGVIAHLKLFAGKDLEGIQWQVSFDEGLGEDIFLESVEI